MKTYFDEATDKRLLEAKTEEEVKAIIAETPEAEKLADKTDLVMAEIARIKGSVDSELDLEELDSVAGGAKVKRIDLSPSQDCMATFFAEDMTFNKYCWSNDQCGVSNEYKYHQTKYSNCKSGGKHNWKRCTETVSEYQSGGAEGSWSNKEYEGYECKKCGLFIPDHELGKERFEC